MPVINTTNPSPENGSMNFFHETLDRLLEDNSSNNMNQYNDSSLNGLMDYLTHFVNFNTISEDDLNKLIAIHAKVSNLFCAENFKFNSNQTIPNSYSHFINFTKAIQHKEEFFNPSYTNYQTRLKQRCEIPLNNDVSTSLSFASKLGTAALGGAFIGASHAATAIAFESAKSKGYTKTQLRLLKAGSDVLNSLANASYASMAAYMENSHEPKNVIIEKMCQSFALSLAGSTSLYALSNGISYFAKSIENKLAKGFLNALPLAGNVCLLVKDSNNLPETAASIGTQVVTAGLLTAGIQTGWHFFSKRRGAVQNTDIELNSRSNEINSSTSAISETPFNDNRNISTSNNNVVADPFYEEITTYVSLEHLDDDGYLIPNNDVTNAVTNSTPGPALPSRNPDEYENHRFLPLKQGKGILLSTACRDNTSNLCAATHTLEF